MASNVKASIVLFLSLNLFLLVSSNNVNYDSNGSPSTTNSGDPSGNVLPNGGTTNSENPTGNVLPNGGNTQGPTGTMNSKNPAGNVLPNGGSTQGPTGTMNSGNTQGPTGTTNSGNTQGPTGTTNSGNTQGPTGATNSGNTQGPTDTSNSGNPVVIRPGNVLPNGNNTQGNSGTCKTLNLGVCLDLLGLVKVEIGNVPTEPCCSVIKGLLDLEAAVCLCTAIRANVLGIDIDLPISLNLLLNNCGRNVPTQYICSH